MSSTQLTFLDDNTLLIISSIGIVGIVTVVLWVSRREDWRRIGVVDREDDGDPAQLGPRTRVVPGGREAAKSARKEAKKKAKAEFKRAQPSSANQQRRSRLEAEKNRRVRERHSEEGSQDRPADISRKLESYIFSHKVSSLRHLAEELGVAVAEIEHRIKELENEGKCWGIVVDDAYGDSSFVRISADEMRAIASFINEKGRLTVEELAVEANRVLQLPDAPKTDEARKECKADWRGDKGGIARVSSAP